MAIQPNLSILYLVSTPIGNLGDITHRALSTLSEVDLVLAEDTRRAGKLLKHFGISKKMISYNMLSEKHKLPLVQKYLAEGMLLAYVVDAGTPLISDPGQQLVQQVRIAGHTVVPIPGACALAAAVSASGIANHKFTFEGFLPSKSATRLHALQALAQEQRSMVFYEAPHRLLAMLKDCEQVFGSNRKLTLAKELTKMYETIIDTTIEQGISKLTADRQLLLGEFVVIIAGAEALDHDEVLVDKLLVALQAKVSHKDAVAIIHEVTGYSKNKLYQRSLAKK